MAQTRKMPHDSGIFFGRPSKLRFAVILLNLTKINARVLQSADHGLKAMIKRSKMQNVFKFNSGAAQLFRVSLCAGAVLVASSVAAQAVDTSAAEALAKKSNCTKCHSVDKQKDGPSYKETAAKYKGKAVAEAKLYKHITTGPMIKIDGVEEAHQIVKSKDEADIKNLIRYILSR
jgi:cytochrome c